MPVRSLWRDLVSWRGAGVAVLCAGLLLAWAGCERVAQEGQETRVPAVSPRETLVRLMRLRESGELRQMETLIVPGRAADVVITLAAVEEYLGANERLCAAVRRNIGPGLAQTIDQGFRAYYLDIFSRHVELLDENIDGNSACIHFVVDGKLPARQADLVIVNGTWRYDPGPGDYQQLAEAFKAMAHGLRQVADEIENGRLPTGELRDNPERLFEEIRVRLLPGVKLLPKPPTEGDNG